MAAHLPKAVLYYNPISLWSTAAILALEEKGYSEEEVELKIVELGKGEHLSLTFLRINPKGTIPTLVVPLQSTLAPEDEHRFKAITDTKSVIEFLDKSRSAASRTHTVSSAPAPALTPATIGMSATSTTIIDVVHSEDDTPLLFFGASTPSALQAYAQRFVPYWRGMLDAINSNIANSQAAEIQASEKTRKLWESKKARAEGLLEVFATAGKDDAQLSSDEKAKRDAYLKKAQELWEVKVRKILVTLDKEMLGPFTLGDQISVADLHLAPWLARVALLCGASASDAGDAIVAKIEQRIGDNFVLPKDFQTINVNADPSLATTPGAKRAKLAAFWDEMRVRQSWKKAYGDQLH